MAQQPEKDRLAELDARIDALKETQKPEPRIDEHYSGAQLAWRMVIELVSGLLIGFGIGYGLDWLFGTLPIFLVIFIFLGFAAGVNVMLRTAKEVQAENEAAQAANDKEGL
ncbi:AtpZ/AtpI family protein [Nereida sp. MMG025]|uniref:AtpZ/AtpI family protein n=1 Tax=Nereida sp. MMG025 TaxID=2909981 RepID=UPI001F2B2696|nr:AtpZ/AtpI family protein [Nereida sp. MMG025]MCF6444195.1 AtpZ/AtpI family protein [Nereida sp. MMG025]